jgi:hypothetical protein
MNTNTNAPVDVLAVFDRKLAMRQLGPDMAEVRAAVAELVAADREYDEARLAYQRARKALLPHEGAAEKVRFLAADARRAAAIAKFRGAA